MADKAFRQQSAIEWAYGIVPHTTLSAVQKRNIKALADALLEARGDYADEGERRDSWQKRAIAAEQRIADVTAERDSFSLKYSQAVNDSAASRWQPLFDSLSSLDDDDFACVVYLLPASAKETLRKWLVGA